MSEAGPLKRARFAHEKNQVVLRRSAELREARLEQFRADPRPKSGPGRRGGAGSATGAEGKPAPPAPVVGSDQGLEARLVWIFGSPRSGSSWLMRLLGERPEIASINESYLGAHLVPIGATVPQGEYFEHGERAEDPSYFFARRYVSALRPKLRDLLITGLGLQVGEVDPGGSARWIVVKEPNGSHAADTVVSILPASRLIFLLRDGRDVVDSLVDAMLAEGTWWTKQNERSVGRPPQERLSFVKQQSRLWVHRTIASRRAFAALPDERRLLIRYEELLANTAGMLRRIHGWLGIDVPPSDVEATVAHHAFDSAPRDRRGPGKDMRSATPGLWRENLTAEEQDAMHRIMGETLTALGYEL